ncbi:variant erythrocyte surface antigen-1 family protein [Babesia caballi]|uniref:Variant erythrocyte surface antigen-1 family protein n=1 Tax=Babesia caballi TaxID=5871 RepID=A0AAV4LNE4_BABCB|nr:variant erythrocyte surface antigen-1 family protein [Babesia caballi]
MCHNRSNLKELVGDALEKRVRKAIDFRFTLNTVAEYGGSIKENFKNVLEYLNTLRNEIVDTSKQNVYGSYRAINPADDDCYIERCVNCILYILPKLYATLMFMLFKVDGTYSDLGGGGWEDQLCNDGGNDGSGTSLSDWLKTKTQGIPSASGSSSLSSPTLLPGGYGSDLKETQGADLVSALTDLISESDSGDNACLPYLLLDFATVTDWCPCSVATHLTVLAALSDRNSATLTKQGQIYEEVDDVFKKLPAGLKYLAPDEKEDKEALLSALFDSDPKKYSKTLKYEAFECYMKWLKDNIKSLIETLKSLSTDCATWSASGLRNAEISGPFGYGFWFGGKWGISWNDEVKKEISPVIQTLANDLETLKGALEKQYNFGVFTLTSEHSAAGSSDRASASTVNPGSSGQANGGPCSSGSSGTVIEIPVPKNLKEAIDWILRVSGGDGVDKCKNGVQVLSEQVQTLLNQVTSSDMGTLKSKLGDVITKLADGLQQFIGYNGGQKPNGRKGIASNKYESAYENDAKWRASWKYASDSNAQKCAKIFLGCVPLIYYGVTYLYWRCANKPWCKGDWEAMNFNGDMGDAALNTFVVALTKFMVSVGYTDLKQLSSRDGGSVMGKLMETFNELKVTSNHDDSKSSFSQYIAYVLQNGEKILNSNPETCPLYTLQYIAEIYWNSLSDQGSEISEAIKKLRGEFENLINASEYYDALKQPIDDLMGKVKKFVIPTSGSSGNVPTITATSDSASLERTPSETAASSSSLPEAKMPQTTLTESSASPTVTSHSTVAATSQTGAGAGDVGYGGGVSNGTGPHGPPGISGDTGPIGPVEARGPAGPQNQSGEKGGTGKQANTAAPSSPSTPPPQPSSSVASAAGTVAAVVVAGGAAAVYFNVGGIGTIVKGLLRIH